MRFRPTVSALAEDCSRARIVISVFPLHGNCRGPELLVDRSDIARTGALAVTFRAGHQIVETVADGSWQTPLV